jgi:hypothetical protein
VTGGRPEELAIFLDKGRQPGHCAVTVKQFQWKSSNGHSHFSTPWRQPNTHAMTLSIGHDVQPQLISPVAREVRPFLDDFKYGNTGAKGEVIEGLTPLPGTAADFLSLNLLVIDVW